MTSRREFLVGLGAAAVGSALPMDVFAAAAAADITLGYASITWGGNNLQAIDDIAALGFPGIQIRSDVLKDFGARPAQLRDILQKKQLTMVALSSGNVKIDPAIESQVIDEHVSHARFVRDVGGLYLQVIDERPKDRA